MFTAEGVSFSAGEERELHVSLSSEELVPGQYLAEIAMFTTNEYGNHNYINTIKNGFWFEIKPSTAGRHNIGWHPGWGHTHLADLKVEVIDHE